MLIDSHCHLPHKLYKKDLDTIIMEANRVGVTGFINIGTSLKESEKARGVADKHDNVWFSVAIYPHEERKRSIDVTLKRLEEDFLINKHEKLVAIGECGIDISNWENGRDIDEQLELFEKQILLAIKYDLPIIIHNRNGDKKILNLLEKYVPKGLRGVVHCFDSDWEFAKKVIDLGFYISFSGMVTFPSKVVLVEVIKNVPLDKFLIETDAPYLAPVPHRGKINYPAYVKIVAEKIAEIKGKSIDEISNLSYSNTSKLFNL